MVGQAGGGRIQLLHLPEAGFHLGDLAVGGSLAQALMQLGGHFHGAPIILIHTFRLFVDVFHLQELLQTGVNLLEAEGFANEGVEAGLLRAEAVDVEGGGGHRDDFGGIGMPFANLPQGGRAVQCRHVDVHEDDVGRSISKVIQGLPSPFDRGGVSAEFDQQVREYGAALRVVVHHQSLDCVSGSEMPDPGQGGVRGRGFPRLSRW